MEASPAQQQISQDEIVKLRQHILHVLGNILPVYQNVFSASGAGEGELNLFEGVADKFSEKITHMITAKQCQAAQEMAALLLSRYPLNKRAVLEMLRALMESGMFGQAYAVGKLYLQIFLEDSELMRVFAVLLQGIASISDDASALGLLEGASLYAPRNESIRKSLQEVKARLGVRSTVQSRKVIWYVTDCFGYGEGGVNGVTQAKSMTLSSLLLGETGASVKVITQLRANLPESLAEFSSYLVSIARGRPFSWGDWVPTSILPGQKRDSLTDPAALLGESSRAIKCLSSEPSCIIVEGVRLDGHRYLDSLHLKSHAPKFFMHHTSPDQFNDTYTDNNMLPEALSVLSGYDCCVCVSENVISDWKLLGDLAQKKWEYIPNCAREEEAELLLAHDRAVLRKKLNLPEDTFIGVCVASVQQRKGQDILLGQMHRILHFLPNARFLFVGPILLEWGGAQIIQYAQKNFDPQQVTFLGAKKNALEYLYAADCLILPSREEALPLTILEAMVLGKPCVASDVNGIPELVVPEKTGLLFSHKNPRELGKHVVRLGENVHSAHMMGEEARKRYFELFARAKHVERWEHLVRSL